MADRYDPKLSVGSMGDRKFSDISAAEKANGDPLAELARVVSGRGMTGTPASRSRSSLTAAPPPSPAPNVLGDLEAELLNDLQASFMAVKELAPARPASPPPTPLSRAPAAPAPPPATDALPRASEGVVRDRLADALAALAPVMRADRSQEIAEARAAQVAPAEPRPALPLNGPGSNNGGVANGSANGSAGQPIMSPVTSSRLRDALNALGPPPLPTQPVPTAEAAFARMPDERASLRAGYCRAASRPPASSETAAARPGPMEQRRCEPATPASAPGLAQSFIVHGAARRPEAQESCRRRLQARGGRTRWEKPQEAAKAASARAALRRRSRRRLCRRRTPRLMTMTFLGTGSLFQGYAAAVAGATCPTANRRRGLELPSDFADEDLQEQIRLPKLRASSFAAAYSGRSWPRIDNFVLRRRSEELPPAARGRQRGIAAPHHRRRRAEQGDAAAGRAIDLRPEQR